MTDLSTSNKQGRSPKRRAYRMRRRAEQVDETRQRITEAAVRLHTTIGPAETSIAKVAEEADVTRLTVYRHFEDQDALFGACMAHWASLNPVPDLDAWRAVERLEDRARRAYGELYAWYARRNEELYPIYRDMAAMPETAQAATAAQFDAVAAAIVAPALEAADGVDVRYAVARHLADFWTWRSLVLEQGLRLEQARDAAVRMLLAVDAESGRFVPR